MAAAVAAAIEADPTLQQAGVTAFADGNRVVTTGTIDSVTSNDPGLSFAPPATLLNAPALTTLVVLLAPVSLWGLHRRRSRLRA